MRMSQMYNNNCLAIILFFEYVLKIMIRGCITNVFSTILLHHYMKNLLSNIYLLNNKQSLKVHLNKT